VEHSEADCWLKGLSELTGRPRDCCILCFIVTLASDDTVLPWLSRCLRDGVHVFHAPI